MKTIGFALLCFVMIAGASCQKENDGLAASDAREAKTVPELTTTDGLIDEWNAFWNAQDAAGLYALLTGNVVVIVDGSTFTGKEDAYNNFILPASTFVNNLVTVKTQENINSQVVWQKGTYTHDVLDENGAVIGVASGDYTIKWKKQDDGSYLVFHASL